jgi:hypothetical protein
LPSSAKPQLQLFWLSVALLSLLNSPPSHPPSHPPIHPVKVSKQLSTAAGKLQMEDNLNFFVNGRRPQLFFLIEDDLNILVNGRRPKFFGKW